MNCHLQSINVIVYFLSNISKYKVKIYKNKYLSINNIIQNKKKMNREIKGCGCGKPKTSTTTTTPPATPPTKPTSK